MEDDFVRDADQLTKEVLSLEDGELEAALNRFSNSQAEKMMSAWTNLDQFLLVKYIDGNIKYEKDGKFETTATGNCKSPRQPEYPKWFYKSIVEDHGKIVEQH